MPRMEKLCSLVQSYRDRLRESPHHYAHECKQGIVRSKSVSRLLHWSALVCILLPCVFDSMLYQIHLGQRGLPIGCADMAAGG